MQVLQSEVSCANPKREARVGGEVRSGSRKHTRHLSVATGVRGLGACPTAKNTKAVVSRQFILVCSYGSPSTDAWNVRDMVNLMGGICIDLNANVDSSLWEESGKQTTSDENVKLIYCIQIACGRSGFAPCQT